MSTNVQLIWKKIEHLQRMRAYLDYSREHALALMPIRDWRQLAPAQHATLAAFSVHFSEFQEHLGKAMRAIAREEEQGIEPFSFVLNYMGKLGIIDVAERWKLIRELPNTVNHEYEENEQRLSEFFLALVELTPELYGWFERLAAFCQMTYTRAREEK